jgi:hypothetical protein
MSAMHDPLRSILTTHGRLSVMVAVFACSTPSGTARSKDDCERFADKTEPVLLDLEHRSGVKLTHDSDPELLARCRRDLQRGHRAPEIDCVLAAADHTAVRMCLGRAIAGPAEAPRAQRRLRRMAEDLELNWSGAFPVGEAPLTPPTHCCDAPGHECVLKREDWTAPVWDALGFPLDEPPITQFAYTSGGPTMKAIAVDDPRCDGHTITFTMTGKIERGKPVFEITGPK